MSVNNANSDIDVNAQLISSPASGDSLSAFPPVFNPSDASSAPHSLRARVWQVLSVQATKFGRLTRSRPSRIIEASVILLILVNIICVVLMSVQDIRESWFGTINWIVETTSVVLFSIEYSLRLWSCVEDPRYHRPVVGRLKWMKKPLSMVDLISLLTFVLNLILRAFDQNSIRTLKVVSMLRIVMFLRLERQSKSFKRLLQVLKTSTPEFLVAFYLDCVLLLLSSSLLYALEDGGPCGADFSNIIAAMWPATSILTTVGYGQTVACTAGGKILTVVVAFLATLLFALPAGILGSSLIEVLLEERLQREQQSDLDMRPLSSGDSGPLSPRQRRISHSARRLPLNDEPLVGATRMCVECPHCNQSFALALAVDKQAS